MGADIRYKRTPISLQDIHCITTVFWIPDRSPLQFRLRVFEILLAIVLIPLRVRTEEFANIFVTLKICRAWEKRGKSLDDRVDYGRRTLDDLERCHMPTSYTLLSTYLTFQLNLKCLWQHIATSNNLEVTKNGWSEISDPIVITISNLKEFQPGTWRIPFKPESEELSNLLSVLQEFTKISHFINTHSLTRYLIKKFFRHSQSSTSDEQTATWERIKRSHNWTSSPIEVNCFQLYNLAKVGDTEHDLMPSIKILTLF